MFELPETHKRCYRCGELKPSTSSRDAAAARGQRDSLCRPCRSAYGKEHYAANRQTYIDRARVVTQRLVLERTRYLLDYFVTHPCVDCGETDPIVLEFDHLRDKRFEVSAAIRGRKWRPSWTRSRSARSSVRTATGAVPPVVAARCARC